MFSFLITILHLSNQRNADGNGKVFGNLCFSLIYILYTYTYPQSSCTNSPANQINTKIKHIKTTNSSNTTIRTANCSNITYLSTKTILFYAISHINIYNKNTIKQTILSPPGKPIKSKTRPYNVILPKDQLQQRQAQILI